MHKPFKEQLTNYFLMFIGALSLAFGSTIFLSEAQLVAGGISGIAIICQHFTKVIIYDYVVAALTVIAWFVGLFFVGKDFSLKTLFSSIVYIAFTFIFTRITFFTDLAKEFAGTVGGATSPTGNLMLCGLFGGIFVGAGVGVSFLGGGSTGGVDVIQVILRKKFNIKESISSPIVDIAIIVVGMITMQMWVPALCGILSSITTALLIELVYIKKQSSYQLDIISKEWEKIRDFAQQKLDRGTTLITSKGGYSGNEYTMLRIVIDKNQYEIIRDYIAEVDHSAFITITQTNAVYGEGFAANKKIKKSKKK